MRAYDIILKKRDGNKLNDKEIKFLISGISNNSIPDYQITAFLMAAFIKGLDPEETTSLTKYMMESGDTIDLSDISDKTVDKHSTGGVGDKISLILAPAVAACGAIVPMMSGRGLGHTGGTLDKLESIPGYRIRLTENEFKNFLKKSGLAIIGQTKTLAPADKKLYSLRDVTATVDSIPLITASIMSKKFAAGPSSIVMDVKCGNGAFMKELSQAKKLSETLVSVGKHMNRKVSAVITDMNQPLGYMIGNATEIIETIQCLQGNGPSDLMTVSRTLAGEMLQNAGIAKNTEEGALLFDKAISDGSAYNKFKEMVKNQEGDISYIESPNKLQKNIESIEVKSEYSGYIKSMDSVSIGISCIMLGGGREKSDDIINHSVGIKLLKKIGDKVEQNEPIAIFYTSKDSDTKIAINLFKKSITISSEKCESPKLIKDKIT